MTANDSEAVPQLALEFANTLVSDRPGRDLLSNEEQLRSWIDARPSLLGPAPPDPQRLADYRRLRASIRALLSAAATMHPPQDAEVAVVNAVAGAAARWPELHIDDDGTPSIIGRVSAKDVNARVMALLAESVIRLVGGPDRSRVGECAGPGCRRMFLSTHPARRWCDPGVCGNRVRVARWARQRRTGTSETFITAESRATS